MLSIWQDYNTVSSSHKSLIVSAHPHIYWSSFPLFDSLWYIWLATGLSFTAYDPVLYTGHFSFKCDCFDIFRHTHTYADLYLRCDRTIISFLLSYFCRSFLLITFVHISYIILKLMSHSYIFIYEFNHIILKYVIISFFDSPWYTWLAIGSLFIAYDPVLYIRHFRFKCDRSDTFWYIQTYADFYPWFDRTTMSFLLSHFCGSFSLTTFVHIFDITLKLISHSYIYIYVFNYLTLKHITLYIPCFDT